MALKLLQRVAASRFKSFIGKAEQQLPREDDGLPLGARVGHTMEIQSGNFDTAGLLGSIAEAPSIGECVIVAISRVKPKGWESSDTIYRYYFATGDQGDDERFLQIFSSQGVVQEILYFTRLHREFVTSDELHRKYSGEAEDGLGQKEYAFSRDELESVLEPDILSRIGGSEELVYARSIGGDVEKFDTVKATEERIDDPFGKTGMRQELSFVPYARTIDETSLVEHLFISYEILRDRGGVKEAHVDFMVGLPIIERDVHIA